MRLHLCDYVCQIAENDMTCNGIVWARVRALLTVVTIHYHDVNEKGISFSKSWYMEPLLCKLMMDRWWIWYPELILLKFSSVQKPLRTLIPMNYLVAVLPWRQSLVLPSMHRSVRHIARGWRRQTAMKLELVSTQLNRVCLSRNPGMQIVLS